MAKLPIINKTKTGRKYFTISGKRIYVEPGVTRKQIEGIYKTLKKAIKPSPKKVSANTNRASAVVNIHNEPVKRRTYRNKKKDKPFVSSIDPAHRTIVSNGTSNTEKDLLNKLINEENKRREEKRILDLPGPGPN